MLIQEATQNKSLFMPLLLLGDEQESMINRYLEKSRLYALYENGLVGVCVVAEAGPGIAEIKNIAVAPAYQRQGYGRAMMEFIEREYGKNYSVLQAGTGDSGLTIPFYEACGFTRSHVIKNFFTENYDHPIRENGILLKDMVVLRKKLR